MSIIIQNTISEDITRIPKDKIYLKVCFLEVFILHEDLFIFLWLNLFIITCINFFNKSGIPA